MAEKDGDVKTKIPTLEILRVLSSDAKRLTDARERCLTIHHTADIDSAGDEVEVAARRVIRNKIPSSYHVGHGHIVDTNLTTSPQIDVLITDNSSPVLFVTENGSEYFPFESVHAIGEVKSTYSKSQVPVQKFVATVRMVKNELKRKSTPPNYLGNGLTLGSGFSTSERRPYRNALFSFMLFVDGGDFDSSQVEPLFRETSVSELPNVVCILNQGVIVNAQVGPAGSQPGMHSLGPLNLTPEFNVLLREGEGRWCFIPFGEESTRSASNLGFLWLALLSHLNESVLLRPNMLTYLDKLFTHGNGRVFPT